MARLAVSRLIAIETTGKAVAWCCASFLLASVAAIGGAIIGGSIYVQKSIVDVRFAMADVRGEVRSIGHLIQERIPARQSTTAATATETHSSTLHKATDGIEVDMLADEGVAQ